MVEKDRKRNQEIDVASGIVMLLVMIGHLVPFDQTAFKIIFSFHMPFFFLKSGYCTSERSLMQPFYKFLPHKIHHLLIPSLITNILVIAVGAAEPQSLKDAVYFIFISPGHEWFMMSLFFCQLSIFAIFSGLMRIKDTNWQKFFVLYMIGLLPMIAALAREYGIHDAAYLPFKASSLCIGLMFVLVGFFGRRWHEEQVREWMKPEKRTIPWIGVGGVFLFLLTRNNSYVNVANGYFGYSDLYFLLTSVFWTFIMLIFARIMTHYVDNRIIRLAVQFLTVVGRNTIVFYIGQSLLYHIFNQILFRRRGVLYTPMIDLPTVDCIRYFLAATLLLYFAALAREALKKRSSMKKEGS